MDILFIIIGGILYTALIWYFGSLAGSFQGFEEGQRDGRAESQAEAYEQGYEEGQRTLMAEYELEESEDLEDEEGEYSDLEDEDVALDGFEREAGLSLAPAHPLAERPNLTVPPAEA